jgi:hypothetical protein
MAKRLGAAMFLEYQSVSPVRRTRLIKDQRKWLTDPASLAFAPYQLLRHALRKAFGSADPERELREACGRVTPAMYASYDAVVSGVLPWILKTRATRVQGAVVDAEVGELTISLSQLINLKLPDDTTLTVLPYFKETAVDPGAADLALRLIEREVDRILPGAVPGVLDTRRGKLYRLHKRRNRGDLDAALLAESARYARHWDVIGTPAAAA